MWSLTNLQTTKSANFLKKNINKLIPRTAIVSVCGCRFFWNIVVSHLFWIVCIKLIFFYLASLPSFTLPLHTLSPPTGAGGGSVQVTPGRWLMSMWKQFFFKLWFPLTFHTFWWWIGIYPAPTNQTFDGETLHVLVLFKIHILWCTCICCILSKLVRCDAIKIVLQIHARR